MRQHKWLLVLLRFGLMMVVMTALAPGAFAQFDHP